MDEEVGRSLQAYLLGLSGKPTRELVNVDLGEKLAALGLAKFFPVEVRAVTLVQGWALCAVVHCRPGLQSMLRANCQQNLKLALSWARSTCTSLRISRSALEQSPCMLASLGCVYTCAGSCFLIAPSW